MMKSFKERGFVTLSLSFCILASASLEFSRCQSAIAAVPIADATGVQGNQLIAFLPNREGIGLHGRGQLDTRSTLRIFMSQSKGRICVIEGGHCEYKGSQPDGSDCSCESDPEGTVTEKPTLPAMGTDREDQVDENLETQTIPTNDSDQDESN